MKTNRKILSIVGFSDTLNLFAVNILSSVQIEFNVVKKLIETFYKERKFTTAGKEIANFIEFLRDNGYDSEMVNNQIGYTDGGYSYELIGGPFIGIAKSGFDINFSIVKINEKVIYSGCLGKKTNPYEKYVSKVVRFTYDGGSKPSAVRTVRVDSIEEYKPGKYVLKGIDLETPLLKDGYRNYLLEKIAYRNIVLVN